MTDAESAPAGRRRRVSHWDRPPPARDLRWGVEIVGRALVVLGLLTLAFVAYQLWGTGIETARAQRSLEDEFEQLLDSPTSPALSSSAATTPTTRAPSTSPSVPPGTGATTPTNSVDPSAPSAPQSPPPSAPASTTPLATAPPDTTPPAPVSQNLPVFEEGDAVARLQIPTLGLDVIVVAGVDREDLKGGPGHYPQTPLPGQLGNASIAGHRSTYGEPFADVDELQAGDEITVTTPAGSFMYLVDDVSIVSPSDTYVLETDDEAASRLTLTSCHPRYSASQRIVVSAGLAGDRSSPVGEPTLNYGRPVGDDADDPSIDTIPGEPTETAEPSSTATSPPDTSSEPEPDTDADATTSADDEESPPVTAGPAASGNAGGGSATPGADADADAFSEGWFADTGAYPHVAAWGLLLGTLAAGGYLVCRRFRNDWSGPLLVATPFVVVLYFFFQNVNRLLPAAF